MPAWNFSLSVSVKLFSFIEPMCEVINRMYGLGLDAMAFGPVIKIKLQKKGMLFLTMTKIYLKLIIYSWSNWEDGTEMKPNNTL